MSHNGDQPLILAKAIADPHFEIIDYVPNMTGDYQFSAQRLHDAGYDQDARLDILKKCCEVYGERGLQIQMEIRASDPMAAIGAAKHDIPEETMPELAIDIPDGAGAGAWIDTYIDYANAVSPMTPRSFHESGALWLAAVAIARRLVLRMPFDSIYPNLFVVWIAPCTLYRKTTAFNIVRDIASRAFGHLLAAQTTTPEALLSDFAGREPQLFDQLPEEEKEQWGLERNFAAQRGWLLDEMSGLLAQAGKDYNAGLIEDLLRFYDCTDRFVKSTRGQGRVVCRNTYLNLIGATTPRALALHMNAERLWAMGWWPRFAVLASDGRPDWQRAQERDEPSEIIGRLKELYTRLPRAQWPAQAEAKTVSMARGVYELWERYHKAISYDMVNDSLDQQLWPAYGRFPVHCLKIAMILAAVDWNEGNAPVIQMNHLGRAMQICETWRTSVHRSRYMANESAFDKLQQRVLYQVGRREPKGASLNELWKAMKDCEPEEIERVLNTLVKLEEIEPEQTTGRGRPTTRYHLPRGERLC